MKRLIRRITRLIDWLPVIWKDHDFDYHSFYVVMQKKLTRLENGIRNGWAVNSEETAENIHFAVILLDRLIAHDYLERALIPVHREWGELGDMITREMDNGLSEWLGNKWENANTEEERLMAEAAFRKAGRRADAQEIADRNLLFEHMSKNIARWWD